MQPEMLENLQAMPSRHICTEKYDNSERVAILRIVSNKANGGVATVCALHLLSVSV